MAIPCSKEHQLGQLEEFKENLAEDIKEIKSDIRCIKERVLSLQLKSVSFSIAISILVYAVFKVFIPH